MNDLKRKFNFIKPIVMSVLKSKQTWKWFAIFQGIFSIIDIVRGLFSGFPLSMVIVAEVHNIIFNALIYFIVTVGFQAYQCKKMGGWGG